MCPRREGHLAAEEEDAEDRKESEEGACEVRVFVNMCVLINREEREERERENLVSLQAHDKALSSG